MLTEGAVTTETGNLFQYFTSLSEKADPLVGVPSKATTSGEGGIQVRINIQETREYLERGDQIDP